MPLSVGVVMDPISEINTKKDSTFAMLLTAKARNHSIYYIEIEKLLLRDGRPFALCQPLDVFDDSSNWFSLGDEEEIDLADLDIILMRKDPPFNMNYVYATYILELAANDGCLVVNRPDSLRDCNEKLFTSWFPDVCPKTLVSSQSSLLKQFVEQHQDVILKPLDGMGGASIFRVKQGDPNVSVIIETLTQHGQQLAMAQKFIPEITQGDKRILMINGEAVPYTLARIPAKGETRGNLAAGGSGVPMPITAEEQQIADRVGPELVKRGLYFVGLDVIGTYLTEINVTSPTCIREIDSAFDSQITVKLWDVLEQQIKQG
ncbi:glutathione synthase [Pleionea mediterranea]|jgi:glutathione synthase|uniref:Glutathione synthetase n=1 Tax=Pleionea mediterranea TaxID=523701 RepID=A0A316FEU8_9GAMM|nr:glutathione synthase [Pleionea mediterranea]PWK46873.1 glutathione synthase [Pleionea mediterranea]